MSQALETGVKGQIKCCSGRIYVPVEKDNTYACSLSAYYVPDIVRSLYIH